MVPVSFSQGLGIGAGLSFWTQNDITLNNIGMDLINKDEKVGFNANLRLKFHSGFLTYTINAGWNRFVISGVLFEPYSNLGTSNFNFTLSQNIFPIAAGLQVNLIDVGLINIYVGGEAGCSFIKNSIDNSGNSQIPSMIMFGDETQLRFGAAPSAGVEINLGIITLDVNARLQFMNLINRKEGEELATYLMANVSVFFSGR
jgi:hypothetical protein